mmetsp:Transcript_154994/g.495638  ORF Transcript_154994/g.495638 Transcript_154994/m.495638 type:complete len:211 (+) Transcript_154994:315-947(+)
MPPGLDVTFQSLVGSFSDSLPRILHALCNAAEVRLCGLIPSDERRVRTLAGFDEGLYLGYLILVLLGVVVREVDPFPTRETPHVLGGTGFRDIPGQRHVELHLSRQADPLLHSVGGRGARARAADAATTRVRRRGRGWARGTADAWAASEAATEGRRPGRAAGAAGAAATQGRRRGRAFNSAQGRNEGSRLPSNKLWNRDEGRRLHQIVR